MKGMPILRGSTWTIFLICSLFVMFNVVVKKQTWSRYDLALSVFKVLIKNIENRQIVQIQVLSILISYKLTICFLNFSSAHNIF